jgi:hypothetical protein
MLLLSWIFSGVEKSLEAFFESFLPKELLVLVLSDEVLSGVLDFKHVVGNDLHASEECELVLDFNQVVTITRVKSGGSDGDADEVLDDFVDNVSDSVTSAVRANSWVEADVSISQVHSDIEHW